MNYVPICINLKDDLLISESVMVLCHQGRQQTWCGDKRQVNNCDPQLDFFVILLPQGLLSKLNLQAFLKQADNCESVPGSLISLYGYPAYDKITDTMPLRVLVGTETYLSASTMISTENKDLLVYNLETESGASGSPIVSHPIGRVKGIHTHALKKDLKGNAGVSFNTVNHTLEQVLNMKNQET